MENQHNHFSRVKGCSSENCNPDTVSPKRNSNVQSLLADLKACSSSRNLERGRRIHAESVKSGEVSRISVATTIINMYAKCGSMVDARRVFDTMKHRDVVTWSALILGYADNGEGVIALDIFTRMTSQGCMRDSRTFVAALKACTSMSVNQQGNGKAEFRDRGKEIHELASKDGCDSEIYVQSTLIDMYAKCGSMIDARQVFDSMKHRNVVSWNALILGYADNGDGATALDMFTKMTSGECSPDSRTFVAALKACTSLEFNQMKSGMVECRDRGKEIHKLACKSGCGSDIYVQSTLIDMYAKCGSMADARQVFDCMNHRDVVSWNALISGYADNGEAIATLDIFKSMRFRGCPPNSRSVVAALNACSCQAMKQVKNEREEFKNWGKQIHSLAFHYGCHSQIHVQSALIDMYAKCGSMVEARQIFDSMKYRDVVSWNALILGYADNEDEVTALDIFKRMRSEGFSPDPWTFVAALKACTSLVLKQEGVEKEECKKLGKEIHDIASEYGCDSEAFVQSTLIGMYAKCGSLVDARKVFDSMKHRDVVSWNALILGYADNGQSVTALDTFTWMRSQGCSPDSLTYLAALRASRLLGALDFGRKIHTEIETKSFDTDVILVNCLVDFYAKCGSLIEAQKVFDSHPKTRNLITWNSMLAGHSRLGDSKAVFELFEGMQDAGLKPDGVTFKCILLCCSHAGLVEKGRQCFESMSSEYGITPTAEHYICMVDNLGRSNKLQDAIELLQSMPSSFSRNHTAVAWMAVLSACRKWKNVEVGRLAFQSLMSYDDKDATAFVLMGDIYGSTGLWQEQEMVRKKLLEVTRSH